MNILSVDIETGGLDPECSLLEIAAIYCPNSFECEYFHRVVKPSRLVIEADAYAMHQKNGLLEEVFRNFAVATEQVAKEFKRWLYEIYFGKQATVIGCNFAGFDGPRILKHFKMKPFWNHRVIDAKQLWMCPSDEGIPTMDECIKRSGIRPPFKEHRAVYDAECALKLFRAWRNRWTE